MHTTQRTYHRGLSSTLTNNFGYYLYQKLETEYYLVLAIYSNAVTVTKIDFSMHIYVNYNACSEVP